MSLTRLSLVVAALVQLSGAGMLDRRLVYDSLRDIEPWQRRQWLAERGLQDYYKTHSWKPTTDSGLRCVGRWSYGPSVKVSLRVTADDTIVCLARGSGASIIRFRSQDSLTLDLLSDINCNGIVSRAIIDDTLVYCGMNQGGTGIEVWGVNELSSPHRLSYVYLPSIMDIAVKDTFLYSIGYQQDSLRVFNVADPSSPVQVGACADSGINGMCVVGNYCYLADQYGLYVVDVSNPTSPHRVAAVGGYEALAVTVHDTLCYVGTYDGSNFALRVFNVADPAMPFPVGSLPGIEAHDIYLPPTCDTVLYTPKLHVINVTNPASPRQIGFVDCPGWDYGVAVVPALDHAVVADDWQGLVCVDLSQPAAPFLDTILYEADMAEDIEVREARAYVASYHAGFRILDLSVPSMPLALGGYDSIGYTLPTYTVAAADSFAYTGWVWPNRFVAVDVTDPYNPVRAGGCTISNYPEDIVLRDSFAYIAELGHLQIVNVARPREPLLVGNCGGDGVAVVVQDSFAYTAAGAVRIANIARPGSPFIVGTIGRRANGLAVRDTFLYIPYVYDTLFTYSVADPAHPRPLSAVGTGVWPWDVVLGESKAYVALSDGQGVEVFDLADPARPVSRGRAAAPYDVRRLYYSNGLVYAAMGSAGVAVYETTAVGIREQTGTTTEEPTPLRVWPSMTDDKVRFTTGAGARSLDVAVFDVSGKRVGDVSLQLNEKGGGAEGELSLSNLPTGLYVVRAKGAGLNITAKVVKLKGR